MIRTLSESFVPQEHEQRVAVAQMTMPSTGAEFLAQARVTLSGKR